MDFDKFYLLVIRYLNIRPRSEREIRDYLNNRNANQPIIDLIVDKLKQQKFVNDIEFARMWVESRNRRKPKGKYVLQLELKQKGISQEIIDELLLDNSKDGKELSLAIDVLERKRKKFESMDKRERFNKAGSLLARRGFNIDTIKKAIEEVFGK